MGTYAEDPNRYDSTQTLGGFKFSSLATPTNVRRGETVYNPTNGELRINIGTNNVPVWRKITNS